MGRCETMTNLSSSTSISSSSSTLLSSSSCWSLHRSEGKGQGEEKRKEEDISEWGAGKATDLRSMSIILLTLSSAFVSLPHSSLVVPLNVKLISAPKQQTSKMVLQCVVVIIIVFMMTFSVVIVQLTAATHTHCYREHCISFTGWDIKRTMLPRQLPLPIPPHSTSQCLALFFTAFCFTFSFSSSLSSSASPDLS